MDIYLVGGAVRDKLLGLSIGDRDWVVVGARPQELLEQGFRQVGKDFPVFLHPKTHEEYALARTERKSGSGYTGFEFDTSTEVTLEQDLLRRDLTINAIAQDSNGALIDPFNGRADIDNKVLRHVSDAFVEDPVRVLRVARFAARYHQLGFTLAPATLDLMKTIAASGELDHLVPERVWTETHRALQENSAWAFFETLRACDALNVIFPEVEALYGVPQPAKWHPEIDTGVHTMMVLQQACRLSPSAEVRFAALVHDIGKGNTPKDILPSHYGHERRSVKLVKKLCDRLKAPSRYRELALIVAEYHGKVHRCAELKASTLLKLLKATDAIRRPERFEAFLIACEADARGRTGLEDNPYPQRAFLLEALEKVRSVDYKDVLSQESDGKKIADAIYKRQVSELKRWKSLNSDEHSDDHNSQ